MRSSTARAAALAATVTALAVVAALLAAPPGGAAAGVKKVTSSVRASDGTVFTATNHLTPAAFSRSPRQYLLSWAGSVAPTSPDFVAVIDATKGSRHYGEVVNTVTLGPQLQNEPHHFQYVWHKGDRLFAGGILADTTFVFDTSHLPALRIVGVNLPADTPCGSAPDAFVTLRDGTAYASYMGGPNVSGNCTYTNGEVREGNGYAGSPGEIVLLNRNGRTIAEIPAAVAGGEPHEVCTNYPLLTQATCANPHGIAVREDLDRMVTSDFAEVRHYFTGGPGDVFDPHLVRNTIRVFDITNRADPELLSVSRLEVGPREPFEMMPPFNENRMVMEVAVTHQRRHRGAFASTMWGGAVFYTPDITAPNPVWREVFDDSTAYHTFGELFGGGDGGSWLAVSPDDRFVFHTVIGTQVGAPRDVPRGLVYVLDVRRLLAAGDDPSCKIDTIEEITAGGAESDCPALAGVLPVFDETNGGPHWAALDNFVRAGSGIRETTRVERMAVANYFVQPLE
ncbi:MAG TPA: hypothetical protein VFT95_18155, partial [Micromonosporaceae bacterium]|nr:hypothetical protein [Micromonosporaceae bacterium]